jgi:fluoride exporter
MIRNFLLVGMGGAVGSMLRYGIALLLRNPGFPLATLLVNIIGSGILGMVLGAAQKTNGLSEDWKLFLATGICGGFTTFSTFAGENLQLLREGRWGQGGLYILLSLVFGIAATAAGFRLTTHSSF